MAKFQARHYRAIADTLASAKPYVLNGNYAALVQKFANMLENDNPNFERRRFKTASELSHMEEDGGA